MSIAITGSSGFVGSVVKRILNIPDNLCFDIEKGDDISTESTISTICSRATTVIHLAAISGVAKCEQSRSEASMYNTEATLNLAESMSKLPGMKRLIFSSSSAVYGEAQSYLMDELHPAEPRTHYGQTKLLAERIMEYSSNSFQIIILRPSNIYGYGMSWKEGTVLSLFISAHLEKRPITITGSGSQKRDFVHIVDISRLYARLATAPSSRSGIYNIGGNETVSMRALAEMVNEVGESVLGYRVPIEFKPDANESLYHDFKYVSDKAKHQFQYEPKLNLRYAIAERMMIHLRK